MGFGQTGFGKRRMRSSGIRSNEIRATGTTPLPILPAEFKFWRHSEDAAEDSSESQLNEKSESQTDNDVQHSSQLLSTIDITKQVEGERLTDNPGSLQTIHKMFGHANKRFVKRVLDLEGYEYIDDYDQCESCVMANHHRTSYRSRLYYARPRELGHITGDLCSTGIVTINNNKYFSLLTDQYSLSQGLLHERRKRNARMHLTLCDLVRTDYIKTGQIFPNRSRY